MNGISVWRIAMALCSVLLVCDTSEAGEAIKTKTASFNAPFGVATDKVGNVYVADSGNKVIRKITPEGMVTTFAGTAGVEGHADGVGTAASFKSPAWLATDSSGNVYVADGYGNWLIRKITPDGRVSTLAGTVGLEGVKDGIGDKASFSFLGGIATDDAGNVYVAGAGIIRKITPEGKVTTLAGDPDKRGYKDGVGMAARFGELALGGMAIDRAGNIYVADTANEAIRKITPDGTVTTLAGKVKRKYTEGEEMDTNYVGVATDSVGNAYVSDSRLQNVSKISPSGTKKLLAGSDGRRGYVNGNGSAAFFSDPSGLATDSAGNVYVADTGNNVIRKITPAGVVTTFAGTAGEEWSE